VSNLDLTLIGEGIMLLRSFPRSSFSTVKAMEVLIDLRCALDEINRPYGLIQKMA
jgi:hypothetical protein